MSHDRVAQTGFNGPCVPILSETVKSLKLVSDLQGEGDPFLCHTIT